MVSYSLDNLLIRSNAVELYTTKRDEISGFWRELCLATAINLPMDESQTMNALRFIFDGLTEGSLTSWKKRLTYVRLHHISGMLHREISSRRRSGLLPQNVIRRGLKDASLVLDLLSRKLQGDRSLAKRHLRLGKRWYNLLHDSTFLAIAFSDQADHKM